MYTSLAIVTLFSLAVVSSTRNVTVTTGIDAIMGKTENVSFAGTPLVVTQFLGIPYAEPPVGARRFRKPKVKAAFNETFIAHTMSPMCFQNLDYYGNLVNATILCTISLAIPYVSQLFVLIFVQCRSISIAMTRTGS